MKKLFYCTFFLLPLLANCILKVDINRGSWAKIEISVAKCATSSKDTDAIVDIIKADLNSTGLFKIKAGNEIECDQDIHPKNLEPQKDNGIKLILESKKKGNHDLELRYRLIDYKTDNNMIGKSLISKISNYRRIAHKVSDAIYNKITGDRGYFNTKIAHVAEINGAKKLAIMDQDTANLHFITNGKELVMTPRLSFDGTKMIYMRYRANQGKVYVKDLLKNKDSQVGELTGLTSAPRFAPDGSNALMARATGRTTDVYKVNLNNGTTKRLTSNCAINTSPSYSPDQKMIAFNSDRAGSAQIYTMNADGTNQKRISYGGGSYTAPVWSPRGDLIAFTKSYKGGFYIGVMKPDGTKERILTTGYLVEGPSWSPNGRLLVFTHEEKSLSGKRSRSKIYSIDVTGKNERMIKTDYNASGPCWSE